MPSTLDKSRINQVMLVDANGDPGGISIGSVTTSAVASASAPTRTEGATVPLSVDLGGALRVTGISGGGGGGDATAANQVTGNASLASIDTKASTTNTSLSSIDTKLTTLETGKATAANQATGNSSLSSIDTKLSSQATATLQGTANTSLSSIDTKLSSQATAANQTAHSTLFGAVTETAPASDTASSGLNGRLQRIAQRITSLIALLPTSLGTKAAASSLAVALSTEDAANLASVASSSASTATVNVAQDTAVIKSGNTDLTPKFASIAGTGSADLVALVSGKKIRVLSYSLVLNAAATAKFQSGATTDLTGAMPFGDKGGISVPFSPVGHFETASGAKLNLVLGTSVAWAGHLCYVEV